MQQLASRCHHILLCLEATVGNHKKIYRIETGAVFSSTKRTLRAYYVMTTLDAFYITHLFVATFLLALSGILATDFPFRPIHNFYCIFLKTDFFFLIVPVCLVLPVDMLIFTKHLNFASAIIVQSVVDVT